MNEAPRLTGYWIAYAFVIFPSTTERLAPVADGMFPGRPCHVSQPSSAKAAASFASISSPGILGCCDGNADLREAFLQEAHECRVLCAPARDEHFGRTGQRSTLPEIRPAEAPVRFEDRCSGQRGGCRDDILLARAIALVRFYESLHESCPELLAPAGLGRLSREVRFLQDVGNDIFEWLALRCRFAVLIESAAVEVLHACVDDHVRWADIEGQYILYGPACREGGYIGDPAPGSGAGGSFWRAGTCRSRAWEQAVRPDRPRPCLRAGSR